METTEAMPRVVALQSAAALWIPNAELHRHEKKGDDDTKLSHLTGAQATVTRIHSHSTVRTTFNIGATSTLLADGRIHIHGEPGELTRKHIDSKHLSRMGFQC